MIQLPSILLRKLQASERLGRYYENINENAYGFMLSRILLAAFNQNLADEDIHRIHVVHRKLNLRQEDLDEWMHCLEESLNDIGLNSLDKRVLIDKIRLIGTYLLVRKSQNGTGFVTDGDAGCMVDDLIHEIDEDGEYGGCIFSRHLIERLKAIRDNI